MTLPLERVAVVGCGLIGTGWASWFLSRGLHVCATDPVLAEEVVRDQIAAQLAELGHTVDAEQIMARFRFEADLARAVETAQWVQENVPERLELKRQVVSAIDHAAPTDTIIASSSSSIVASALQPSLAHPGRVIVGHPFLPVTLIPLVEVAGGSATPDAVIDRAMDFYRAIGKQPIRLLREITGHVANRLQAALMREAMHLLVEGVASGEDIDLALTHGPGMRWPATGPIASHHLAGGPGGARAAFANLGGAMANMWADLGTPQVTPELEAAVNAAADRIMAARPAELWTQDRRAVVHAIEQARAAGKGKPKP